MKLVNPRRRVRATAIAGVALAALVAAGCSFRRLVLHDRLWAARPRPPRPRRGRRSPLTFWDLGAQHGQDRRHLEPGAPGHPGAGSDAERRRPPTSPSCSPRRRAATRRTSRRSSTRCCPRWYRTTTWADISKYDDNLKSDFPAGNWNQVTLGGSALYGVPQDAAPMALFYRTDLFKKYGLTVADDLGTVRRRRHQAAQGGARRLPGYLLRRRPGRVLRAGAAGGRPVVVSLRHHLDGRHRQRRQPEGDVLLARPDRLRRGQQPAAVDRPRGTRG